MLFSYCCSATTKTKSKCWQFRLPWRCSGTTRGASPNRARSGLHWKPLNAAIGKVPAPYCPGSCHGQRIRWNNTNTNKTQLLASNYVTFWVLVVSESFISQNGPSTQVIDATSFLWNDTIGAGELPLDAAIEKLPVPYRPGGRHGQRICGNNTKH